VGPDGSARTRREATADQAVGPPSGGVRAGHEDGADVLDHLVQPLGGCAAWGTEVLAGGVEQDGQVLAADVAGVGAPGLADGGVELLAVGAGLDLGEPAAPQVDAAGRAVQVGA
jgi:hypothetical protein